MLLAVSSINFMGFDFLLEIDFIVTDWGSRATWDDPGWGPEFDIQSITLLNEDPDHYGAPPHRATGALFRLLANLRSTNDAILQTLVDFELEA
jgi:hypothetical protein